MIVFKEKAFFVVPKEFCFGDIEFNVFNSNGEIVGTNFLGIRKESYLSEVERFELEEIIENATRKMEHELKFMKEYGAKLDNWESLAIPKKDILRVMWDKWGISKILT